MSTLDKAADQTDVSGLRPSAQVVHSRSLGVQQGQAIVIASGKGGVGKTTIVANLGVALAATGKRVCVVDADIGLRNLDVILGLENRVAYDLIHVIEKRCRLHQALIRDPKQPCLSLLPAAQTRDKDSIDSEQMKVLIAQLKCMFDYVLVDSPAGIEQGFRNAICGADRAIVVTTPEVSAIRDADRIIGLIEKAGLPEPHLLINRYRLDMVERNQMLDREDIIDILALPLIGIVPYHDSVIISSNCGIPVAYNEEGQLSEIFRRIAGRVLGNTDVDFYELSEIGQDTLWNRFKRIIGFTHSVAV